MAKQNNLKTILLLGALGIGGYLIYKSLTGSGSSVFGSGYSNGWIPGDTTPKTPANNDSNLPNDTTPKQPLINEFYEDKQGYKQSTSPVVTPKPDQFQGGGFVADTSVPKTFAPVINEHIPQVQILPFTNTQQGQPSGSNLTVTTPELKQFATLNPELKQQAPVNIGVPGGTIVYEQPLPLQNWGVNVTSIPSVTIPSKTVTQVVSGTTNKQIVVNQATKLTTPITTPVVRVTDVLKGLIAR